MNARTPEKIAAWQMVEPGKAFVKAELPAPALSDNDVLVEVAGCGVCHTDLSFVFGGVKTKKAPPLVLGHEISGTVVAAGAGAFAQQLAGKNVLIPAVLPCGECDLCRSGRGNICQRQVMPGNDFDGGFASHVRVPARFLCELSDLRGFELHELCVIADAATTPYQAIKKCGLKAGELAIFIGVGGVGGYGVQLAAALGATVIAVDIDPVKLGKLARNGAKYTINSRGLTSKDLKNQVRALVKEHKLPQHSWRIFETSGTAIGQDLAFNLLTFAGSVSVVGFTMDLVNVRLSNLMAFDAAAYGNWGCLPEYYPAVVRLAVEQKINIRPFSAVRPMSEINQVFEQVKGHQIAERVILRPDF